MEMGAGEDKLFDSKRSARSELRQFRARRANGFAILRGEIQELEAVVPVVEMAKFGKHAHRRLAPGNDELQPNALLRDQWFSQRGTEAAQSDAHGCPGEFDSGSSAEVLNANFNGECKARKCAEILTTLLSEGRHGRAWFITPRG